MIGQNFFFRFLYLKIFLIEKKTKTFLINIDCVQVKFLYGKKLRNIFYSFTCMFLQLHVQVKVF